MIPLFIGGLGGLYGGYKFSNTMTRGSPQRKPGEKKKGLPLSAVAVYGVLIIGGIYVANKAKLI